MNVIIQQAQSHTDAEKEEEEDHQIPQVQILPRLQLVQIRGEKREADLEAPEDVALDVKT